MSELLREIVAPFLKLSPSEIEAGTFVDRTAVGSSIVFHRMFAKLSDAGFGVNDYHDIRTFGELESRLSGQKASEPVTPSIRVWRPESNTNIQGGLGVDLVEVASMPIAADFRDSAFYQMNFSDTELSHCILQANPYASFAGLFAAKEAICKADNRYRSSSFRTLEIQWNGEGKPFFPGMEISISHTDKVAAAAAVVMPVPSDTARFELPDSNVGRNSVALPGWVLLAVVTSLLLSVVAILLSYYRN